MANEEQAKFIMTYDELDLTLQRHNALYCVFFQAGVN